MIAKTIMALGAALALSACVTQPERPVKTIFAAWNTSLASFIEAPGPNTLKGNGFMRQAGGGVVTCAGSEVTLIPASHYAAERLTHIYGSTTAGFSRGSWFTWEPDPPEYTKYMRRSQCDAQGNFVFEQVPDGAFFVVLAVRWRVGTSAEGGSLMKRVELQGGKVSSVIISG